MATAQINSQCIIGLPQCGYAFQSSRQAFIAIANEDEYQLELSIIQDLLTTKNYNNYVALEKTAPAQLAFCSKICAQIIQSQFCIVILNPSSHHKHKTVQVPNPNVHMEYGLMLGFRKYIIPLQRDSETLSFNISPLDTIKYNQRNFRKKANDAIDQAILTVGQPAAAPKQIAGQLLLEYLALRGLRVTRINGGMAEAVYKVGEPLGYNLVDGPNLICYLGLFDAEQPSDVLFKAKLLVQSINNERQEFERNKNDLPVEQAHQMQQLSDKLAVEIIVRPDADIEKMQSRFKELTTDFWSPPITFTTMAAIEKTVQREKDTIGKV